MPKWLVLIALLSALGANAGAARAEESIARQEAQHLFNEVPDTRLTLPRGEQVNLASLWGDKPVLVTLFYQRCTGTCSPFLRSLSAAIERVGGLGEDYRVVSISFDPEDTAERVGELARELKIERPGKWLVGVAPPEEVAALTEAIGFWYRQLPDTTQFDHPSLIVAVHHGRIVRVLLGNTVSVPRFRELVMELKGTHVPYYTNPDANTLFRCFEIDETTGELGLSWGLVVLLVPGFASVGFALMLFRRPSRRERPARASRRWASINQGS